MLSRFTRIRPAMLYAPDLKDEELEQYAVSALGRKLEESGVSVRVGFESSAIFESRDVEPARHVDWKMLKFDGER